MALSFQWPYREARDGIWGTQTSTLNWCEEDYNITPYIAEFINTVTNLLFIALGIMGIRDCLRYGHGSIYVLSYVGYIIVGLGSMAFHATLLCECTSLAPTEACLPADCVHPRFHATGR